MLVQRRRDKHAALRLMRKLRTARSAGGVAGTTSVARRAVMGMDVVAQVRIPAHRPRKTRRWRKTDSNPQSPLKKDPPRRDVRPFQHFPSRGTEGSNPPSSSEESEGRRANREARKTRGIHEPNSGSWSRIASPYGVSFRLLRAGSGRL